MKIFTFFLSSMLVLTHVSLFSMHQRYSKQQILYHDFQSMNADFSIRGNREYDDINIQGSVDNNCACAMAVYGESIFKSLEDRIRKNSFLSFSKGFAYGYLIGKKFKAVDAYDNNEESDEEEGNQATIRPVRYPRRFQSWRNWPERHPYYFAGIAALASGATV